MKGNKELRLDLDTIVSSENEDNWWRPELFEKNTRNRLPHELEIITSPPAENINYNCFVYALQLQGNPDFLGTDNWDFTRILEGAFEKLIENGLLQKKDKAGKGDLIIYRTLSGSISHVGVMLTADTVISKWSWGPLIKHSIFDVPADYGNDVLFYTISSVAREFVLELRDEVV